MPESPSSSQPITPMPASHCTRDRTHHPASVPSHTRHLHVPAPLGTIHPSAPVSPTPVIVPAPTSPPIPYNVRNASLPGHRPLGHLHTTRTRLFPRSHPRPGMTNQGLPMSVQRTDNSLGNLSPECAYIQVPAPSHLAHPGTHQSRRPIPYNVRTGRSPHGLPHANYKSPLGPSQVTREASPSSFPSASSLGFPESPTSVHCTDQLSSRLHLKFMCYLHL